MDTKTEEEIETWFDQKAAYKPNIPCFFINYNECPSEALFRIYFEEPCTHAKGGVHYCLEHKDYILNFQAAGYAFECPYCWADVGFVALVERI